MTVGVWPRRYFRCSVVRFGRLRRVLHPLLQRGQLGARWVRCQPSPPGSFCAGHLERVSNNEMAMAHLDGAFMGPRMDRPRAAPADLSVLQLTAGLSVCQMLQLPHQAGIDRASFAVRTTATRGS